MEGSEVHPDGKRVAVVMAPESKVEEKRDKLVFVLNFFDELRRAVATKK
jgi:hypothetical protein